jgi:hypothetical protein
VTSTLLSAPTRRASVRGVLLTTGGLTLGLFGAPAAFSSQTIEFNFNPGQGTNKQFEFIKSGVKLTIDVLGSTTNGNSNAIGICAFSDLNGCGDQTKNTVIPKRVLSGLDFTFDIPVKLISYDITRIRVDPADGFPETVNYTPTWTNGSTTQAFSLSQVFPSAIVDNPTTIVFNSGLVGTLFTNTTAITPNDPFFEYRINNLVVSTHIDPVPAPLPIFGAGLAFGWSRKLRQRIKKTA